MSTLRVKVIRKMYCKRLADGTMKYQGAAISSDGKITHLYCEDEDTKTKLTGFYLLKDFRITPRPDCVFDDYTTGTRVRFFVLHDNCNGNVHILPRAKNDYVMFPAIGVLK